MKFKTPIVRSNLCDYNDAYLVVKGSITVKGKNDAKKEIKCSSLKLMPRFHNAY